LFQISPPAGAERVINGLVMAKLALSALAEEAILTILSE
jgi:hypothetical protein